MVAGWKCVELYIFHFECFFLRSVASMTNHRVKTSRAVSGRPKGVLATCSLWKRRPVGRKIFSADPAESCLHIPFICLDALTRTIYFCGCSYTHMLFLWLFLHAHFIFGLLLHAHFIFGCSYTHMLFLWFWAGSLRSMQIHIEWGCQGCGCKFIWVY